MTAMGAVMMTACLAGPVQTEIVPMQNQDSKNNTAECPAPAALPAEPGWELAPGAFSAERNGDSVVVRATGMNPTPNFSVQFILLADGKLALYRKRPGGMQLQVLTGFSVCATLKNKKGVDSIVIRDRQGEHAVKVEAGKGAGK